MYQEINGIKVYGNYVGGHWLYNTNDTITIKAPATNEVIGQISKMDHDQIDELLYKVQENKKAWQETPTYQRVEILYRAAKLLEERSEMIAEILMHEISKDKKSALSEIKRTVDFIRFTGDLAKGMVGESLPGDYFPGYNQNKYAIISREPIGTVLAISPFNYPINLAASKIAPALAMGNHVVVKPATQGAISTLHLVQVFIDAGLDHGEITTVTGEGRVIGDYLVNHPKIDFINFTGSSPVGRSIASQVSLKPLLMELGGKDPAIILEDANLDLAAKEIVAGAYSYSGQRCTAVKRVLVMESIADTLVSKIEELVGQIKSGMPNEEGVTVTPLINTKAADFVMELVEDAKDKNAKFVIEGSRKDTLITPYLIDHVTTDMRIAWEEPFGPILPIIRVKSIEEAIDIANRSEYGLQSSIFTESINSAMEIAKQLEVGTVQMNNKTERGPDHYPFTGIKSSGIGTQGVKYSMEAMSRLKAFVLNVRK